MWVWSWSLVEHLWRRLIAFHSRIQRMQCRVCLVLVELLWNQGTCENIINMLKQILLLLVSFCKIARCSSQNLMTLNVMHKVYLLVEQHRQHHLWSFIGKVCQEQNLVRGLFRIDIIEQTSLTITRCCAMSIGILVFLLSAVINAFRQLRTFWSFLECTLDFSNYITIGFAVLDSL